MKNIRFRYSLPVWILACALTACSPHGGDRTELHAEPTMESSSGADAESSSELPAESSDPAGETAEGYQFVRDLGICAPGSAVIYQLKNLNTPELKNEYGTAQMISGFYQDGNVILSVLYKDYSVYLLSEEETQEYLRTEKENQEKQERGESADWDDSYFCIDEEKQIYGRSAFLGGLQKEKSRDNTKAFDGRLYRQSDEQQAHYFNQGSSTTINEDFLEKGYVSTLVHFKKNNKILRTNGPGGIYRLQLNYFDEPFTFEFEKVPEYASLGELPGAAEKDGVWFYAEGEKEDDSFEISSYTFSEDKCQVEPQNVKAFTEDESGRMEELLPMHSLMLDQADTSETFSGIMDESLKKKAYLLPDKADLGQITTTYDGLMVIDHAEIGTFTIPVPEPDEDLDIKSEFPGGTLAVTKVSRMEEKRRRGTDADGDEILEPQLYLTAAVKDREEDRHVFIVMAADADRENDGGSFMYTFYSDWRQDGEGDSVLNSYEKEIQGFKISYEEGQESVRIRFCNPISWWKTRVALPVLLCES